jgi:hypothetical protein
MTTTLFCFTPAQLAKMKPENAERVRKAFDLQTGDRETRLLQANAVRAMARAVGSAYSPESEDEVLKKFLDTWDNGTFVDPEAAADADEMAAELIESGAWHRVNAEGEHTPPRAPLDREAFLQSQRERRDAARAERANENADLPPQPEARSEPDATEAQAPAADAANTLVADALAAGQIGAAEAARLRSAVASGEWSLTTLRSYLS